MDMPYIVACPDLEISFDVGAAICDFRVYMIIKQLQNGSLVFI